ncbi:MAG: hypothetical protein WKH68_07480 [Candidatus Limnocylindria bacterium]
MLPSPLTILAAVVAAFFMVLVVARGPIDADYWWHLETGRLILESGDVPTNDPFSFAYDGPWVAHEWLGEVVIAALVGTVGYPVTAAIFGLATAGALLVPAFMLHRHRIVVRALTPFLVVGTYVLASFATVRPQVLSWLLLAVLLALLFGLRVKHRIRPWLVVPLLALWANLHGLWIVGVGVVGVYVLFSLLGRTALATRRWTAVGMLLGGALACAITPAGLDGIVYPLRYLRQDDWGTSFIAEWQPADFTDPRQWGVALLIIAVIALGRRGAPGWLTAVAVVGALGALVAVRNAPLAAVMTMPMLAIALDSRLRPPIARSVASARQRRILEVGLAAVVVVGIVIVLPPAVSQAEDEVFPSAAMDQLVAVEPDVQALVDYDWGGWAIHRLYGSGGSVFIDGRSDMYPREIFEEYLAIRAAESGWQTVAADRGVEAILLPPSAPLASMDERAGWCEAFRDERAVLLVLCDQVTRAPSPAA